MAAARPVSPGLGITLLTPHYYPETGAAAQRITAVAEAMAARGWRVTVITQLPHHPQNHVYEGFTGPEARRRRECGVDVVRLRPWIVSRSSLGLRLLSESRFCLQAMPHVLTSRPDVILASSPYMFLGPTGLLASRIRRARFVWDVRDLTWLYPRAAGKRTFGLDRALECVMRTTASRSDGLTTATDGLLQYFARRPEHSMVWPNGVSSEWLERLLELRPPDMQQRHAAYAGLLGYNHGLMTVVSAAARMPSVAFTIAGDGPERGPLEVAVTRAGLTNVRFVGHLDREGLLQLYASASVLVSHVRSDPIHRWAQPAKLWEYMATGRPVVHGGEGEVVDILEGRDLAVVVPPDDVPAMVSAIASLLSNSRQAESMGEHARAFVIRERNRSSLLAQFAEFIGELSERPR